MFIGGCKISLQDAKESLQEIYKGGSFEGLVETLHIALLLRYFQPNHLRSAIKHASKYASNPKIFKLADLGYLKLVNKDLLIFTATDNCKKLLKEKGYNHRLLPEPPTGKGIEIYNTDVFVQALKLPNFKALLFPGFGYVIPDALLVLAENNRYQLNFLEIEAEKTYWEKHLRDKRYNYNKLATDETVYKYWKKRAEDLHLPIPSKDKFKFQVMVIGDIEMDFGEGWVWRKELKN
jgi:hypothetical protein